HEGAVPVEVFGNTAFPAVKPDVAYPLTLGPHSFYWFSLQDDSDLIPVDVATADPDRLPLLEVERSWKETFSDQANALAPHIPAYLRTQRWFGGKGRRIKAARVTEVLPVHSNGADAFLTFVRLDYIDGTEEAYQLPLAYVPSPAADRLCSDNPRAVLGRVRAADGTAGIIVDALTLKPFCDGVLELLARRGGGKGAAGTLAAGITRAFKPLYDGADRPLDTRLLKTEQSNTSVVYGNRFILKWYRRLHEGLNPDLEIGTLLTRKGFPHVPAVAGHLEYRRANAAPDTLAVLQVYVPNQGDAWEFTMNHLHRFFEQVVEKDRRRKPVLPVASLLCLAAGEVPVEVNDRIGMYAEVARILAQCTARMHSVLAAETEDDSFAPVPFSKLYQRSIYQSIRSLAVTVLTQLQKKIPTLPQNLQDDCRDTVARKETVINALGNLLQQKLSGLRLRCHGDFHLGQLLFTGKDFMIIDFEGEPARPVQERRIKRSPLRDVAGMLRSFHYAAHSALLEEQRRGIFQAEDRPLAHDWAEYWYRWVSAIFLKHYFQEADPAGFLPASPAERQVLLDALLIEKVIYELGYELNNRPDWLPIPIFGLRELLRGEG
ncbi:MAG: putative maltokinase, partial [Desulfatitalea sp.]|nr:putative maltokinase [Desulfatitalea sp.]